MGGLEPYDAILVASYGGPDGPDDVLPFMRNATAGRGIPDERLVEVSGHYQLFGGRSPINERNAELVAALRAELGRLGVDVPVVIGNRNWHPFFAETLRELADAGARRVLVLLTAAYASYSSCRQYRENLADALAEAGVDLQLDKIGPYAESFGFVRANARAVTNALGAWDEEERSGVRVLFVTHSIPRAMDAASGPGGADGTYSAQHARVARRIMARVREEAGLEPDWEIAYCSRSGAPHIPWLEPDVNDRLGELAAQGVNRVLAVPFGFVNDHMEVVYDLDTQAAETAERLGLSYVRAATAGTDRAFVAELADRLLMRAAVARGEAEAPASERYLCPASCCGSGRPGGPTQPTICSERTS